MDNYKEYVGKVLDKRYKILDVVGHGGMAVVLKAEDLVMNRLVALKILSSAFNGDEAMEQRFINESKAVAMSSHKNIVSIYDVAIFSDMKYIVMEFLDGITLKEYMDSKGILFWKEASFYAIQILKALEHAHSKGIVHRDIKPQNIMLNKNGEIKVTDFGIAKLPNASALTVDEKAIGTVYYISPEQASGKATDFHADLYSVGIMLYEMITGKLPFVHENAINVAMMQVNTKPEEPIKCNPAIPEGLNQIVMKAMEKDPANRFQSAHSMLKALEVLYNNPDVVFTVGSTDAADKPNAVNINSIETASIGEIAPYEGVDASVFAGKAINQKVKEPSKKAAGKPQQKSKRSLFTNTSQSMFPIIAGVSGAALIVFALVLMTLFTSYIKPLFDGSNKPTEIRVPDLVGQIYDDELIEHLKNGAGYGEQNSIIILEKNITEVNSNKPKGEILEQSKTAGKVVLPDGDTCYKDLKIKISAGPTSSIYTDLLIQDKATVETQFNEWGVYNIKIVHVGPKNGDGGKISADDMKYAVTNTVLRIENANGEQLKTGDTIVAGSSVTLYVFVPNTHVIMFSLSGMTVEEAEEALRDKGLSLGDVSYEDCKEGTGVVVSQSHAEEKELLVGSKVNITVRPVMPELKGLTKMEAEDAWLLAGVKAKYVFAYEETDELDPDVVMSYAIKDGDTIEDGEVIPKGKTIVITLSKSTGETSETSESSEDSGSISEETNE